MSLKPGMDAQESYQDLLQRAEVYFKRLTPAQTSQGVVKWLEDLADTRIWELIENYNGTRYFIDDPDDALLEIPEVPE